MNDLLNCLETWHQENQHEKIVDAIQNILKQPQEPELNYQLVCLLARALNNLSRYGEALQCLRSVADQGKKDSLWHFRVGYAFYYLGQIHRALAEFHAVLHLDPEDEDAPAFISWCLEDIKNIDGKEEALCDVDDGEENNEEEGSDFPAPFSPELYSKEEIEAVEAHIQQYFGPFDQVFHEIFSPDIHVDIAVIPPNAQHNYYTLVTMGMGAHYMSVPETLMDSGLDRAEILLCLPPDWNIFGKEEKDYWPIRWLKILARLPGEQDTWLGWGHTVPNQEPLAENTALCGMLLVTPGDFPEDAPVCVLPNGEEINFYQAVPLYEEEMEFKIAHGADELLERLNKTALQVVNVHRENTCAFNSPKQYLLSQKDILPILTDWEGPQGCLATDRITVDGEKIAYMYREKPQEGHPTDSGWRFLAGDESADYLDDPYHTAVFTLNTICNYDPDIIPFLNAPYGVIYRRGKDGVLRLERFTLGENGGEDLEGPQDKRTPRGRIN